jgi:precorrin-6A/cobalt-precorrin-6A reductase
VSGLRVLILGGTEQSRALAEIVAGKTGYAPILSLAGRTKSPGPFRTPIRLSGFGGADGLADYLRTKHIDALIDATHPFAAKISAHATVAAAAVGVPRLLLHRPPWTAQSGDQWLPVVDIAAAASALGESPKRVFLTIGRQEVAAFQMAPQHTYLVRSIDPIQPRPNLPQATYIEGRGPFATDAETELLRRHQIEVVVAKNSGGDASYGKIVAARELGIQIILLQPPELQPGPKVTGIAEAVAWLDRLARQ